MQRAWLAVITTVEVLGVSCSAGTKIIGVRDQGKISMLATDTKVAAPTTRPAAQFMFCNLPETLLMSILFSWMHENIQLSSCLFPPL